MQAEQALEARGQFGRQHFTTTTGDPQAQTGALGGTNFPEPLLTACAWNTSLVGLIGAAFAANLLLRRGEERPARPTNRAVGTVWGTISGFTSFVSHAGGPPYQIFVLPLRLEKTVFAGTTTILFAYVNAIKLVPYWALGQLSLANLKVAAVLTLPAVLSVFLGVWLVKRLPTKLFFRLVVWALLLVSLKLLWDAMRAALG